MNKILSIPVEKFSLEEFSEDSRIAKLSLKFMHSGENLNRSFISLPSIKNAIANSLNNTPTGIPILAAFEEDGSDFKEHNDDEINIGCIPPKNNNINYQEENDKTYVYTDGYIWRYYSKNAIDILEQSKDGSKGCSIEIEILSGHKDRKKGIYIIDSFQFLGVTLLGDKYPAGMSGANAKLDYSFKNKEIYVSQLKELSETLQLHFNKPTPKEDFGTGDKIEIDLTKESADMDKDWSEIDKTKLRNDLLKAKNYKTCINNCYLMVKDEWEDSPSKNLKYPVCEISDGKLILSAKGCESALSFLEENTDDSDYDSAKAKLKKYYKKLGLSTENFSENINKIINKKEEDLGMNKIKIAENFKLTVMQLYDVLYKAVSEVTYIEDWYGESYECSVYWLRDFDESFVYAYNCQTGIEVKIPYTMNGDNPVIDFANAVRIKYISEDWIDNGVEDESLEGETEFSKTVKSVKDNFVKTVKANVEKTFNSEKEKLTKEVSIKDTELKKFSTDISGLNTIKTDLETKLETSKSELITVKADYIEAAKKFSALEATVKAKETEINSLKIINDEVTEKFNAITLDKNKTEKKAKAEVIFSENAELLTIEEIEKFSKQAEDCEDFKIFEAELKSFLFDKAKERNKNADSHINYSLIPNNTKPIETQSNDENRWAEYSKEYNK